MATDGTGPKRGQRDGAVGEQFWNRSKDSSPPETTGWSGPMGQSGLLQTHRVPF